MVRLFVFLSLFYVHSSHGKVLLVSDIDDTLKVSRAQNLFWNVINAYRSGPSFRGMAELYGMLAQHKDVKIVYVTNAHDFFMRQSHSAFLKKHKFPEGDIFFWSQGYKSEHKFATLSELLKDKNYELVILVGDNGKADPMVYKKIETAFPETRFVTFIRDLYANGGTPLEDGAKAFMSSAEVSRELCKMGLIPPASELQFRATINQELRHKVIVENQVYDAAWTRKAPMLDEKPCLKSSHP
ncbi:MAG: DUF2183 domain-containing protein [Bdellovibrionales bacterium]|nr:DUF2183 domain-containing protein [Bdellovibrionales bacterium]